MSTKIFYNDNRIIIDGHADTAEECRAITAMCDSLANDESFKTIVYEKGHAVFEQIAGGDDLKFAMVKYVEILRYEHEVAYTNEILATYGSVADRLLSLEDQFHDLNDQIYALKNAPQTSLPYTAEELIALLAKLNNL